MAMAEPTLTVLIRIRPVSVRFTDASIPDFSAELRAKPTIIEDDATEPGSNLEDRTASRRGDARASAGPQGGRKPVLSTSDEAMLNRLLAEEEDIVRIFKQKIRAARPSLAHRRLRLIHAGRILKDGIKLVSWLDSLEAHRTANERAANRSGGLTLGEGARAALGGLRDAAERSAALDLDSLTRRGRQGLGELWRRLEDGDARNDAARLDGEMEAGLRTDARSSAKGKGKGKARLIDDEGDGSSSTAEWDSSQAGPPASRGFKVIEDRSSERVYLQCSIGDEMTPEEEAEANAPRTLPRTRAELWGPASTSSSAGYSSPALGYGPNPPSSPLPTVESPWADADSGPSAGTARPVTGEDPLQGLGLDEDGAQEPNMAEPVGAPRGFDRLAATAGLSNADIEEMRTQFRLAAARGWGDAAGASGSGGLGRSGDVLREAEEEEHARALEEQWIDSMGEGMDGDANRTGSGLLQARFEGLFVGFFFPFLPLFFWRDKTGHPARLPRSEYVYDPQRPGEVIRADEIDYDSEDDDDVHGPRSRPAGTTQAADNLAARNIVFTPTMAQAIVVGLVCNFVYGILASLW